MRSGHHVHVRRYGLLAAIHSVPDRSHGYCIDDNARALLLACASTRPGRSLSDALTARLAASSLSACLESGDTGRFGTS
jgi:hypothetical protein